jgi:hypothetical protein
MSEDLKFDKPVITQKPLRRADFDIVEKPNHLINNPLPGKTCPICNVGMLDYNGLLNLICVICGYTLAGCST